MSCTDPLSRSPGELVLYYEDTINGIRHSVSWNFSAGYDITNISRSLSYADAIAALLEPCLTNNYLIADFAVKRANGSTYYAAPLTAVHAGARGVASGAQKWVSQTLDFEGHGQAITPGGCAGRTAFKLFIEGGVNFTPKMRQFDASADSAFAALLTYLNGHGDLGADYFGQKAPFLGITNVQFNAYAQRKEGT